MAEVILDASALLAFLNDEPGAEVVDQALPSSAISAVNMSEVVTKLADHGASAAEIDQIIADLPIEIVDFDLLHAQQTGQLRTLTAQFGLSLGDRACFATARLSQLPVLTADQIWAQVEIGVEVRLIR